MVAYIGAHTVSVGKLAALTTPVRSIFVASQSAAAANTHIPTIHLQSPVDHAATLTSASSRLESSTSSTTTLAKAKVAQAVAVIVVPEYFQSSDNSGSSAIAVFSPRVILPVIVPQPTDSFQSI